MKQQQELVYISDYRCRLDNKNRIIINIGSNERIMAGVKVTGTIDGKSLPVDVIYRNTIRSRFCYRNINNKFNREYQVCADVNNNFKTLQITLKFAGDNDGVVKTITIPGKSFRKNCDRIQGCVDVCEKTDEGCKIEGWAADAKEVKIKVLCDGKELTGDFRRVFRQDIADYYQDGETSAPLGYTFDIINNSKDIKKVRVIYYTDDRESDFKFNISKSGKKSIPLTDVVNKVVIYTRKYGFTGMLKKAYRKITHKPMIDYNEWYKAHKPSEEELKEQRKVKFDYMPKFSIIIPVYRPVPQYFTDMIKSIKHQTYSNWEICIADGGGEGHTVDKTLFGLVKGDKVRYVAISENLGISGNTNEAMKMATGDYFVLGDHDDVFEPDALFECARAINSKEKPDMIYSDEDKITEDGKKHCEPYFKPDFNIDLLRNNNYICHLFVFSRELSEKVGYFRKEFDGAQDYDMILRCSEKAKCIKHIPKVLYSWRIYSGSTSANPESKRYAFTAGKRAIDEHFKRMGIKAEAEMNETYLGIYRSRYEITGNPLISILIPNKDHTDDLDKCIKSILKQKYENYEIIVIENNSTEDATFEYYKKLEKECNKVKVVYYKDKFNYSKINNFGRKEAKGEYLLLLNNDTEMINDDCLNELLSYTERDDVGITGARLLYEDNTVQHAGVVIGYNGLAGHTFVGNEPDDVGYHAYVIQARDYSAVTAACLMVKASLYDEVGGFEEELEVAFNDVDFCLKVREKGYLVVYNPYAVLHHYESKSRGYEDTPEKRNRFEKEAFFTYNKWEKILADGDPCYNPNLTLSNSDFSLRE